MPRYKTINNLDTIKIPVKGTPPKKNEKLSTVTAQVTGMSYSMNPQTNILDKVGVTATRRLVITSQPLLERIKYLFTNKPFYIDENITLMGDVKGGNDGKSS